MLLRLEVGIVRATRQTSFGMSCFARLQDSSFPGNVSDVFAGTCSRMRKVLLETREVGLKDRHVVLKSSATACANDRSGAAAMNSVRLESVMLKKRLRLARIKRKGGKQRVEEEKDRRGGAWREKIEDITEK